LSLFIGLIPLLVIVTLGFRYTVLIEDRVATERGGYLNHKEHLARKDYWTVDEKQQCVCLSDFPGDPVSVLPAARVFTR